MQVKLSNRGRKLLVGSLLLFYLLWLLEGELYGNELTNQIALIIIVTLT